MIYRSYFKIKELELENWGPIQGTCKLEFSLDENKNVTYIIGNNGAGKTFCFQAIKWLVFLEQNWEHIDTNDPIDILNNIVKDKASTGSEVFYRAKLTFESFIDSKKFNYEIERKQPFSIELDGKEKIFKKKRIEIKIIRDDGFNRREINESEYSIDINKYFPSGPRNFFFLDGERMSENFKRENLNKIKEYTIDLSDIPILHNLNKVFEHFQQQNTIKITQKERQINRNNTNIQKLYNNLKLKREDKSKKKELILNLNKEVDAIKAKFGDLEDSIKSGLEKMPQLNKELEKLNNEFNKLESQLLNKNNELSAYLRDNGPFILISEEMEKCFADLNDKKQKKILPKFLDATLIEQVLNDPNKMCICQRPVDDNVRELLMKIKDDCLNRKAINEIETFDKTLQRKRNSIKNWKEHIKSIYKEIKTIEDQIVRFRTTIEEKTHERAQYSKDPDKWEKDFKLYNELNTKLNDLQKKITELDVELKDLDAEIKDIEQKCNENGDPSENTDTELIKFKNRNKIIEDVIELVNNSIPDLNNKITDSLQAIAFQNWKTLIEDPDIWEKISIENNEKLWLIQVKKKDMNDPPILSQGQRHILGISFLTALASLFQNKYPLIFDSPFGRLGKTPIINIGKNLPALFCGSQIILFVTDNEDGGIHNSIQNRIGKEYRLNKIESEKRTELIEN